MQLLPGWKEKLEQVSQEPKDSPPTFRLPRSPSWFAAKTTMVATADAATAMSKLALQRPIGWIGLATVFRYDRPGVTIDSSHTAHDVSSVRPLLLSLALAESEAESAGGVLYRFVVDLRLPEVLDGLKTIFRLPYPFVGHCVASALFVFWKLGLEEPRHLWDTFVAEKALHLGRHHKRYLIRSDADDAEQARTAENVDEQERVRLLLTSICNRYDIVHGSAVNKEQLARSFLDHPDGRPFSDGQIAYAAADAAAAAWLYLPQAQAAATGGILQHLVTVEMPWVITNAGMTWVGVKVDAEKSTRANEAANRHHAELGPVLAKAGVTNVRSDDQLKAYFGERGLLQLFARGSGYSFKKEQLASFQDRDPSIALIRALRRVLDLQKEGVLSGRFVGSDGRVHPDYRHLGTHTGRQTSRWPNVLGLGRVFRPLIVPGTGRGIGEVDLSQIEIGVAGAVYGDAKLVEMFNTGDVYSAMAQHLYRDTLEEGDRGLGSREFKTKHRDLRDQMKACTLGIIYGLTDRGLALQLGLSLHQAKALHGRFMAMFPTMKQALSDAADDGALRGYAMTATGLRRNRASRAIQASSWERNWLTNHPVQGSAAVVFKAAGNRLDRLYRQYDAWLILAVHDAYVFEAPLDCLAVVASLTRRVMCEAVQEYFPQLRPNGEINTSRPDCWNKPDHADSVERWMEDPMYSF